MKDHIRVICESLIGTHKSKSNGQKFLSSGNHIQMFLKHLGALPKFTHPLQKHKSYYVAVKELVKKVAGDDDPETVSGFLKSQFQSVSTKGIS